EPVGADDTFEPVVVAGCARSAPVAPSAAPAAALIGGAWRGNSASSSSSPNPASPTSSSCSGPSGSDSAAAAPAAPADQGGGAAHVPCTGLRLGSSQGGGDAGL